MPAIQTPVINRAEIGHYNKTKLKRIIWVQTHAT